MRILVSKPDSLGDQLIVAGWVQALARANPEGVVIWHVRPGNEEVASLLEGVDVFQPNLTAQPSDEAARLRQLHPRGLVMLPYRLDPYEEWTSDTDVRLEWWTTFLRAQTWDVAIAAVGNRTWVAEVTVAVSKATLRIGAAPTPSRQIAVNRAGHLIAEYTPVFTQEIAYDYDAPESESLGRLFQAIGLELNPPDPRPMLRTAFTAPSSTERRILLAPGVGGPVHRAWPSLRFAELGERLKAGGWTVEWVEGPSDAPFFAALTGRVDSRFIHRVGTGALATLATLLRTSAALVCNDTAFAHLAAVLGVPTVAIYGGGQRSRFHPRRGSVKVVQGLPPCAGCQWHCVYGSFPCVAEIPVDDVEKALVALIEKSDATLEILHQSWPDKDLQSPLVARLQHEILHLDADRFARLQIIQTLLDQLRRSSPPAPAAAIQTPPPPPNPIPPKISVIIPVGRPERATPTLRALAAQTLRPAEWEVIAVGAQIETLAAAGADLPLRIVPLPERASPSQTRRAGVAAASGQWYLFVDDDIELAPDFFERALLLIGGQGNLAGFTPVGAFGARLPGRTGTFWERLTDISNFWSQQSHVPRVSDWLYSATMLVRAEAYHAAGGFDPEYPVGEDVDLTQRIVRQGFRLCYEPSLVAYHHHRRDTPTAMWSYFWQNGNGAKFFFRIVGGASVFSVKTVWLKTWSDLQMNREFQKRYGTALGWRTPLVWINYLIVETSIEWHWQRHLAHEKTYCTRPVCAPSDETYVKAMTAIDAGKRMRGTALYLRAILQDFANPVRR